METIIVYPVRMTEVFSDISVKAKVNYGDYLSRVTLCNPRAIITGNSGEEKLWSRKSSRIGARARMHLKTQSPHFN
jgi:hypothetical protein